MKDKIVLITGAARRLGAATAQTLHRHGAHIAIHYRGSRDEAGALVEKFNGQRDGSAIALQADLADPDAPGIIVERVLDHFGRLDVLINNASTFYATPVGAITMEAWDDLMASNLRAPIFLAQEAAPALRDACGAIINMIDIHARRPLKQHSVYCAAKAGLAMLTLSLAKDLGPEVRVNGIAPGPILWPENQTDDDIKRKIVAETVLKRSGDPRDIGNAILFLLRDAPFVTGQILAVDGGRSLGW